SAAGSRAPRRRAGRPAARRHRTPRPGRTADPRWTSPRPRPRPRVEAREQMDLAHRVVEEVAEASGAEGGEGDAQLRRLLEPAQERRVEEEIHQQFLVVEEIAVPEL